MYLMVNVLPTAGHLELDRNIGLRYSHHTLCEMADMFISVTVVMVSVCLSNYHNVPCCCLTVVSPPTAHRKSC